MKGGWIQKKGSTGRQADKKMPCSGGGMEQGGDPKGKGSACCWQFPVMA